MSQARPSLNRPSRASCVEMSRRLDPAGEPALQPLPAQPAPPRVPALAGMWGAHVSLSDASPLRRGHAFLSSQQPLSCRLRRPGALCGPVLLVLSQPSCVLCARLARCCWHWAPWGPPPGGFMSRSSGQFRGGVGAALWLAPSDHQHRVPTSRLPPCWPRRPCPALMSCSIARHLPFETSPVQALALRCASETGTHGMEILVLSYHQNNSRPGIRRGRVGGLHLGVELQAPPRSPCAVCSFMTVARASAVALGPLKLDGTFRCQPIPGSYGETPAHLGDRLPTGRGAQGSIRPSRPSPRPQLPLPCDPSVSPEGRLRRRLRRWPSPSEPPIFSEQMLPELC